MDDEGRAELKKKIVEEIEMQKHLIESFTLTSKPVAPDNGPAKRRTKPKRNRKSFTKIWDQNILFNFGRVNQMWGNQATPKGNGK